MPTTPRSTAPMTSRRAVQLTTSTLTPTAFGIICASSPGRLTQIAGLFLIAALACALWFIRRDRFDAIVPATGLTLAFLILAGLALAAVHVLSTIPVALTVTAATLLITWAGDLYPIPALADRKARPKPPSPLAVTGVLVFAVTAILAVRYAAASATADADGASSVALWAYPAGGRLHVGVEQPPGHGATSLRIVVTQAGATLATWDDVHLTPGQTWEAPALTVSRANPTQVVALHDGTVVASLSSR